MTTTTTTQRTLPEGIRLTTDLAKAWTVAEWRSRSLMAGQVLDAVPSDATAEDLLELRRQLVREQHERRKASRK